MGGLTFWVAAFAVPAILVMLNAYLRHAVGLAQTACADVALMLIAFDAAVLIEPHGFEKWIAFPIFVGNLPAIFVINLLIGITCWIRLVMSERELELRVAAPAEPFPLLPCFSPSCSQFL
jgi:hypothetical protein